MSAEIIKRDRECGDCSVCCFVSKVEFKTETKPPHKHCLHVINNDENKTGSCGIFGQECRPTECNSFKCSWLYDMGELKDRPDQSGVMISVNELNGGAWIFIIETKEGAVLGKGKDIVIDVISKVDLPAIVTSYGIKPPNDTGDKVIVKDSLMSRAKNLSGEKLASITDSIGIYKLIDSKAS